jgi:DNA-binding PadR family transcriptional regulator
MKLTGPLERVLRVFLADLSAPRYGYDLMKATKLPSGTLYPMLARLQAEGLLTSEWEPQPDDASGRPPRKYYQLTGEGARVARLELPEASLAAPHHTRATTRPACGSAH